MNDKPNAIMDYCPRCDEMYLTDLPHDCEMTSKPFVPAMSDDASRVVWNAAIEAAAKIIDDCNREGPYNSIGGARRIRELKK
jgi:hypothetical protein